MSTASWVPIDGDPEATVTITSGDVAALLATALAAAGNDTTQATGCLISIEDNSARIAFGGAVPTQGGSPDVGHYLVPGQTLKLRSAQAIATCQYINATNGQNATLHCTLERSPDATS